MGTSAGLSDLGLPRAEAAVGAESERREPARQEPPSQSHSLPAGARL